MASSAAQRLAATARAITRRRLARDRPELSTYADQMAVFHAVFNRLAIPDHFTQEQRERVSAAVWATIQNH